MATLNNNLPPSESQKVDENVSIFKMTHLRNWRPSGAASFIRHK